MEKKKFQDVVKRKGERKVPFTVKEEIRFIETQEFSAPKNYSKGLWFIALCSIVFLLFALFFLFSGATVSINPKTQNLVLSQNLSATKDSSDSNDLTFNLVTISGEETKTIQGGEEKDVAIKAKGTVILYNTFSSASQNLAVNTRLEGSNGKIYRTNKKITLPGLKGNIPGSVEVEISGLEAGSEYNSDPIDFKVLGFKGTPKYSKIYGRSKGVITGGLKGKYADISDDQKTSILDELKNTLQNKLVKKISDQIPAGYILFKDATSFENDEGTIGVALADGSTPITLKGTLYGFLFKEKDLTEKIIESNLKDNQGKDIYISNLKNLTFILADKANTFFKSVVNINFNLSGSAQFVWQVDEGGIADDLLGKKKKEFNQIMSQYSNIDSADSTIKPIWAMSFPDKSKSIKVIVNYPQ